MMSLLSLRVLSPGSSWWKPDEEHRDMLVISGKICSNIGFSWRRCAASWDVSRLLFQRPGGNKSAAARSGSSWNLSLKLAQTTSLVETEPVLKISQPELAVNFNPAEPNKTPGLRFPRVAPARSPAPSPSVSSSVKDLGSFPRTGV